MISPKREKILRQSALSIDRDENSSSSKLDRDITVTGINGSTERRSFYNKKETLNMSFNS